ncbi:MAG: hypothetical protein COA62_11370 [Rhodobiaceae bacterium]|nr:MAG: hypothetical protein COA62_11370 [Rhodobiaceae bacterium]
MSAFTPKPVIETVSRRGCRGVAVACLLIASVVPASAANNATMAGGRQTIALGDRATFPVQTSKQQSTDFSGWCELTAAGSASVVFDGRHYIPLSEPAVGDVINFNGPGVRRFEMSGTFEASSGNASISFYFANVPVAFCFGGGDCATVGEGSGSVIVECGQN